MIGPDPVRAWLGLSEADLYCVLLALLFTGVAMLFASSLFPSSRKR
jgi:hypothetical protein